jgi:hypothetical protein
VLLGCKILEDFGKIGKNAEMGEFERKKENLKEK